MPRPGNCGSCCQPGAVSGLAGAGIGSDSLSYGLRHLFIVAFSRFLHTHTHTHAHTRRGVELSRGWAALGRCVSCAFLTPAKETRPSRAGLPRRVSIQPGVCLAPCRRTGRLQLLLARSIRTEQGTGPATRREQPPPQELSSQVQVSLPSAHVPGRGRAGPGSVPSAWPSSRRPPADGRLLQGAPRQSLLPCQEGCWGISILLGCSPAGRVGWTGPAPAQVAAQAPGPVARPAWQKAAPQQR